MTDDTGDSGPEDRTRAQRLAVQLWVLVSIVLGAGMVMTALIFPEGTDTDSPVQPDVSQLLATGATLLVLGCLMFFARHRVNLWLSDGLPGAASASAVMAKHPYLALFMVSFVVLFIEVMFIRYAGSQFRIFAFYKNIPLVSCFLGLGLGCFLRNGSSRHALLFLLWMFPLAAFLSQGAHLVDSTVSALAAAASSEFILGDRLFRSDGIDPFFQLTLQVIIGLFCVITLITIAATFSLLGRLLGSAFEQVPRLPGYTMNILGSLAGIILFVALSYLETPPWVWYAVGLVPLLGWIAGRRKLYPALVVIVLCVAVVVPDRGETVWSRYQKLIGHQQGSSYLVQISDAFYQVAVDLRPEAVARMGRNPAPQYSAVYEGLPTPNRVLIVGAGTGNDVAAALRAGASRVDAVDIDPAIVKMGRQHHPERPYDDPRVNVIIDDARSAFRSLPVKSYDAVVFGFLDSHTQLGMSSVRLDNYVFTLESFAAARRLLKPGGAFMLSASDRTGWMHKRFIAMLGANCDTPVNYRSWGAAKSFVCVVNDPSRATSTPQASAGLQLPTDDWPFLYLPSKSIPQAYIIVVLMLAMASVLLLRKGGLNLGSATSFHTHMFFLGAAFLLMEVYAINRLALLFGTVWLVSAITIGLVLLLIVLANLTVTAVGRNIQKPAYAALAAALVLSYWIDPSSVLGKGMGPAVAYGLFILSPVYFAGLIFAHSFRASPAAGPAIGANILGAVLGGWVEYSTMVTGIKSMAMLALVFYIASFIALTITARRRTVPGLAIA